MPHVAKALDGYLSDFERFEGNGAFRSPSWIRQIRKTAIGRFAELGFPTPGHPIPALREEWKHTSVAPIAGTRFTPAASELNGLTAATLTGAGLGDFTGSQLVFLNGRYSPALSSLRLLPDGVRAGGLAAILDAAPGLVEPHLARYAGYEDHPFVALNTAFLEDGAFVYIPNDAVVEAPIHLLFLSTVPAEATVSHPRTLIVAGRDSRAAILETYLGLADHAYFINAVTEVVAGENAVIDHYTLQQESEQAFHIATLQVHQDRRSTFSSYSIALGGALVRTDLNVVLDGEGSDCTLDGLYMAGGRQHLDNHTRVDHVKPHGTSRQLYKGILDGAARGVFTGKIVVHPSAPKTDARQVNKNLLLSKDAMIDTTPQLEINNNDVKCSHGSTIGRLDDDAIFYLRSRGIALDVARGLLTYAFASDIINRIKNVPLRAALDHLALAWLQARHEPKETL